MTTTPSSSNVQVLVPLLTPYAPTAGQFAAIYPYALDEFEGDDPGCSDAGAERALAYLIAHYLAGKDGDVGLASEKIDDYQYSLSGSAASSSRWYAEYRKQIERCRQALAVSAASLTGTAHEDAAGLTDLHLDQNPIAEVVDTEEGV